MFCFPGSFNDFLTCKTNRRTPQDLLLTSRLLVKFHHSKEFRECRKFPKASYEFFSKISSLIYRRKNILQYQNIREPHTCVIFHEEIILVQNLVQNM